MYEASLVILPVVRGAAGKLDAESLLLVTALVIVKNINILPYRVPRLDKS